MFEIIYSGIGGYSLYSKKATYHTVLPNVPECVPDFKNIYNFTKIGGPDFLVIEMSMSGVEPDPNLTLYPDLRNISLKVTDIDFSSTSTDITEINRPTTREDLKLNSDILVMVMHDDEFDLEDMIKQYHDDISFTGTDLKDFIDCIKGPGLAPRKFGLGTLRPI
ncbi:hypothetical protein [Flavobacterium sp. MK4S-17]|uniref:hypothetical protein n=1 Tax=Flavobacterium sp. MK4S-17 TaxID=2543737 RepID=UPI0013567344|nr:hypothetical protein [Flavobacterium sp. MK4S-17]